MQRLKSMGFLAIYVIAYLGCEHSIHLVESNLTISLPAGTALTIIAWLSAAAATVEAADFLFELGIRAKIKELFEDVWHRRKAWTRLRRWQRLS